MSNLTVNPNLWPHPPLGIAASFITWITTFDPQASALTPGINKRSRYLDYIVAASQCAY